MRFLAYRPRSAAEVRVRLLRRFPAPVVEEVMGSLAEKALVDDSQFARLWTDSRNSLRPRSAGAIRRELISKGVARDLAEATVSEIDDHDSAYRAGLKPARRMNEADPSIFRRKLWGYLQRRGFSPSVTRQTIARLWDEQHPGRSQPSDDSG